MHAVAPTVLLVDDDAGDQELTRRALDASAMRVDLQIAGDGEQAMAYLRRAGSYARPGAAPRPTVILLDLNMPRMNGRQVLAELGEDPDLRRIPVVVLTTSRQEEDIRGSYDLGCNTFIEKPTELDAFVDAIRQVGRYWFELAHLPEN